LARLVGRNVRARRNAYLLADKGAHARRRFSQVVEERAEITHDTELRRNTEAHVIATTRADESPVGVIEVKMARELIGRRLAIEPAVTAFLGLGQKADGHGKVMQKSWCFILWL
jgi:hypothetical protein